MLAQLVDVESLSTSGRRESPARAIGRVRAGLAALISATHRYRCKKCGYISSQLAVAMSELPVLGNRSAGGTAQPDVAYKLVVAGFFIFSR